MWLRSMFMWRVKECFFFDGTDGKYWAVIRGKCRQNTDAFDRVYAFDVDRREEKKNTDWAKVKRLAHKNHDVECRFTFRRQN